MAASALLTPSTVEVEPGSTVTTQIVVRNTGSVVDEFFIEVIGEARAWTTASPATVSLFPGGEERITLTIAPARVSSQAAGDVDLAVKVSSKEDPNGSVVEEGIVTVGVFHEASVELVPRTVSGSRKASAELAVDNRGNERTTARLQAEDPDAALRITLDPADAIVEPGAANFSRVEIKPLKTFWRGPDRTISYTVVADTVGRPPIKVGGTFVQKAKLPRWLIRALLLLLLLLIALLVLWQGVLKPVVRSTARAAAEKQVDQAAEKAANDVAKALGATPGGGAPTTVAAGGGGAAGAGGGDPSATTTTLAGGGSSGGGASTGGDDGRGGTSADHRIEVTAKAGATAAQSWDAAPGGTRFSLTDIVLQNPQGDTGLLRIKRGDDVLLETAVENFRDLDFHYVAAYVFEGQALSVELDCRNPDPAKDCRVAASFAGFMKKTA